MEVISEFHLKTLTSHWLLLWLIVKIQDIITQNNNTPLNLRFKNCSNYSILLYFCNFLTGAPSSFKAVSCFSGKIYICKKKTKTLLLTLFINKLYSIKQNMFCEFAGSTVWRHYQCGNYDVDRIWCSGTDTQR